VNQAAEGGIKIPASAQMDGQIIVKSSEKNDDESEHNDHVKSLNDIKKKNGSSPEHDLGSIEDERPFDFQLEKYDSFMVESDDSGIGMTLGSQKFGKKSNERKGASPVPNQQGKRNQPLSKYMHRQMFDRFKSIDCASKSLLV